MADEKVHVYHVAIYTYRDNMLPASRVEGDDFEVFSVHYTGTESATAAFLFPYVLKGYTAEIRLEA